MPAISLSKFLPFPKFFSRLVGKPGLDEGPRNPFKRLEWLVINILLTTFILKYLDFIVWPETHYICPGSFLTSDVIGCNRLKCVHSWCCICVRFPLFCCALFRTWSQSTSSPSHAFRIRFRLCTLSKRFDAVTVVRTNFAPYSKKWPVLLRW